MDYSKHATLVESWAMARVALTDAVCNWINQYRSARIWEANHRV